MNILTEEGAKKKVCCGPPRINEAFVVRCSASNCMAWRWHVSPETAHYGASIEAINPGANPGLSIEAKGFCGLAGQP